MYQNFSRAVGFGSKGYSLLIRDQKKIKNVILISGSKSNYNYALEKLHRILKKKPKHIILKQERYSSNHIHQIYERNKKKTDTIIALGGGSIIDFSKRLVNKLINNKKISFYIIPTILGSGAESSISSIITSSNGKNFEVNEKYLSDGIIYDENLIKTVNKLYTLMGIIDSFSHCIESLTSINKNHYLNFLSFETLNAFIKKNSLNSLINKNEFDYFDIATLSLNGGLAQSNSGSGICHALAHNCEQILNISHSEGITFFIKPVIKYLQIKNKKDLKGFDPKLFKYVNKLSSYIIKNGNFHKLKKSIYKSSFINNLIDKSKNDICWKLYNKNIDINLLNKCIKNEKY